MTTRTHRAQSALAYRSASSRRIRRLSQRLYCSTNGCTTFLEVDREHGVAVCPVCGAVRSVG
jgi:hypothetical protein